MVKLAAIRVYLRSRSHWRSSVESWARVQWTAAAAAGLKPSSCSTEEQLDGFNPHAAEAVIWTRNQLSAEERQWLRDLKYSRMAANFTMVHATLDAPERWGYVFDKLAASASFPYQNTQVCFFGHTHVPVAFMRDTAVRGGTYSKFKVDPAKKYFVNVGAVGQPRDNNPKAAYVIYDADAQTIELRRLDYDIATTQKKILAAGLPERLEIGRAHV